MTRQQYKEINLRRDSLAIIEKANSIIEEYLEAGLRMTLRQLYYQFVSRGDLENTDKNYDRLGRIISDGRIAGLVDWDAIEDRGRVPDRPSQWDSLQSLVDAALSAYRLDRWKGQPRYVELWVEKQALAGVLEPLARDNHVTLMVNKGYSSQTAMRESALRFMEGMHIRKSDPEEPRKGILLYLGDFDPSGEDMVRDIRDRLGMFLGKNGATWLEVRKIALTMEQIRKYKPPPNPAKVTDSRAAAYIALHGDKSWEVDALPPTVLAKLIQGAINDIVDAPLMAKVKQREATDKEHLREALATFTDPDDPDDDGTATEPVNDEPEE
jgi:hypothetical protein